MYTIFGLLLAPLNITKATCCHSFSSGYFSRVTQPNFFDFPPDHPGSMQKGERALSSQLCFALCNVNIAELETKTLPELRDLARDLELSGYSALKKQDLVFRLLQANTEQQGNIFSAGVLEIVEDGFGFLRQERFLPGNMDVYVSQSQIRRFGLRTGDMVSARSARQRTMKSTMVCCVSRLSTGLIPKLPNVDRTSTI